MRKDRTYRTYTPYFPATCHLLPASCVLFCLICVICGYFSSLDMSILGGLIRLITRNT